MEQGTCHVSLNRKLEHKLTKRVAVLHNNHSKQWNSCYLKQQRGQVLTNDNMLREHNVFNI